jgi:cytochrome c6
MFKQSNTRIKLVVLIGSFVFIGAVNSAGSMAHPPGSVPASSAEIYAKHCIECHGRDGRAKTAKGKRTGATDFAGTDWNTDEGRAIRIISNGKGEMPTFKGKLTAREIRSVAAYVRQFRN